MEYNLYICKNIIMYMKCNIREYRIKKIISDSIKKILKEGKVQDVNHEIKEYTPTSVEWGYIKENIQTIWTFLNNGYQYVGYERFCGCDSPKSLLKNANLIKIAFSGDIWIAISVYTGYRGGFKNVGIAATTDSELRDNGIMAVREIIKKDIGHFNQFYWAECSGAVERLYEKYGGIKIPNDYAFGILQKVVRTEGEDEFHYLRDVKGEMQRKIIYGFNSQETFEKVLKERTEYINNSIKAILSHQIDEAIEQPSFAKYDRLDCAIAIVNFFVDQRWEEECYDFPSESLLQLRKYVSIIKKALDDKKVQVNKIKIARLALENGIDILETSSYMQIHMF